MPNQNAKQTILFLEDANSRFRLFEEALAHTAWLPIRSNTADGFAKLFAEYAHELAAISLDHDLFEDMPDDTNAGDGMEVARFLSTQTPCCPIVIHSSNAPAAVNMQDCLKRSHWKTKRIPPIGQDWVSKDWLPTMSLLINQSVPPQR